MGLSPEIMQTLAQYGPILLMVVIFYFMLYRPQKKEQQRRQEMLNSLKKGDKVLISPGILGSIVAFSASGDVVTVRIAEKVEIDVLRSAIGSHQEKK